MEYFDLKTNKSPYPTDTDKHYLVVKKNVILFYTSSTLLAIVYYTVRTLDAN